MIQNFIEKTKSIISPIVVGEMMETLGYTDDDFVIAIETAIAFLSKSDKHRNDISVDIAWNNSTHELDITDDLFNAGFIYQQSNIKGVRFVPSSGSIIAPRWLTPDLYQIRTSDGRIYLELSRFRNLPGTFNLVVVISNPYILTDTYSNIPVAYEEGICYLAAAQIALKNESYYSNQDKLYSGIDHINYDNKPVSWHRLYKEYHAIGCNLLGIPIDNVAPVSTFASFSRRRL